MTRTVNRLAKSIILGVLGFVCVLDPQPQARAVSGGCGTSVDGSGSDGYFDITGHQGCDGSGPRGQEPGIATGPPSEWFDCGAKVSLQSVAGGIGNPCQQVALECETATAPPGAKPTTNLGQFQINPDGTRTLVNLACNTPTRPAPAGVSAAAVWQEIRRRVPRPAVGVAPASGRSLVQIQTLFWVHTPAQVELGTVRLAGQLVRLRVTLRQVAWDFGDGHTDTSTDPGKTYTTADPCDTKMCPDYYGHVYHRHGTYPVSAQVSWTGQFQLPTGPWRQIPNPVTGPPQTTTVHIYQAHGELVPDPTDLHPAH